VEVGIRVIKLLLWEGQTELLHEVLTGQQDYRNAAVQLHPKLLHRRTVFTLTYARYNYNPRAESLRK